MVVNFFERKSTGPGRESFRRLESETPARHAKLVEGTQSPGPAPLPPQGCINTKLESAAWAVSTESDVGGSYPHEHPNLGAKHLPIKPFLHFQWRKVEFMVPFSLLFLHRPYFCRYTEHLHGNKWLEAKQGAKPTQTKGAGSMKKLGQHFLCHSKTEPDDVMRFIPISQKPTSSQLFDTLNMHS